MTAEWSCDDDGGELINRFYDSEIRGIYFVVIPLKVNVLKIVVPIVKISRWKTTNIQIFG